MKIEQLIFQQLFRHRKVTLQDIGTFSLSPEVALPTASDKAPELPENAVHFEFDKHAQQDEEFLKFIIEKTGKMRALASSDLESYSLLVRQFVNIGKPFSIEGLGVLQKNQEGGYRFISGVEINPPAISPTHLQAKEKSAEEIPFSVSKVSRPPKAKWGWLGLILFLLAITASVYFYLQNRKSNNELQKLTPVVDTPTTVNVSPSPLPDTLKNNISIPKDTILRPDSLRLVFKYYNNLEAAKKAMEKFKTFGHAAQIQVNSDSSKFELYLSFPNADADTSRIKDSISRFFGTPAYFIK